MIDLSHVPEIPGLSVFLPQGTSTDSWQVWNKPRGFVMCSIYAIGPGGGGGSGASTTVTGGGGGGGSGGVSRLIIPLFLLPDVLHVLVSPGGSGGASVSNAVGISGNVAYAPFASTVSMAPSSTAQYVYLEANAGGGGAGGTSSTVPAAAGAAAAIATARPFALLGATLFVAGIAGGVGGYSTIGGDSISQGTGSQIYGGPGGGGGSDGNGNAINALAGTPFQISFPISSATSNPNPGANGFSWNTIFPGKIYGGFSGGGRLSASAFPGGNGSAWGAGGGGGGSNASGGFASGAGGNGGPGAVIIQCW